MHFLHVGHIGEKMALGIVQAFDARGCFGTDGDLGKLIAVKVLNGGSTRGDYHVRTAEYFYLYFRFVVHIYNISLHFFSSILRPFKLFSMNYQQALNGYKWFVNAYVRISRDGINAIPLLI